MEMQYLKKVVETVQMSLDYRYGIGKVSVSIGEKKDVNKTYPTIRFGYPGSNVWGSINIANPAYPTDDVDAAVDAVIDVILSNIDRMPDNSLDNVEKSLYDYDGYVKQHLIPELISADQNKDLLDTVPWMPYLDFAVIFRVIVTVNNNPATVLVNNSMADHYNISAEQLFQDALENNLKIYKPKLLSFSSMGLTDLDEDDDSMLYTAILVDAKHNNGDYGATTLLYPEFLSSIAEKLNSDFVVIPSSIHEVLIIRPDMIAPEDLKSIIFEVNHSNAVADNEVLSGNAYYYSRETGNLTIYNN